MVRGAGRGAGPSVARADSANPSPLPPSSRRYSYPLRAGGAQRVPGRVKYWPQVGRVDNEYGDRNLFCICIPLSEYA